MKGVIDLLGIVLPLLLLIVFFFRSGIKAANTIGILLVILLLLIGILRYVFFAGGKSNRSSGKEPVPLAVSKHSLAFNQSVQSILDAYYNMSESLVNWDAPTTDRHANELKTALDNFKVEELKIDTGIYESALDPLANAQTTTSAILSEPSLEKKRMSFNQLSEDLRLLFIIVKYDANKLYWQECPMAFGDDQPGNWLSKTAAVRNPYLGNQHPKYKDGMLECGGPKDTINFMATDKAGR